MSSITETYNSIILNKIIMDLLKEGNTLSTSTIEDEYNTYIEGIEFPIFEANNFKVVKYSKSSASKYNLCNQTIYNDLYAMYSHLFNTNEVVINNFNRWRKKSDLLENRLINLEKRIEVLLLLSNDTAGYLNYLNDHFIDTSKVDLTNTTAYVNLNKHLVQINPTSVSTNSATKINLSNLTDSNISFTVLTRNNLVGVLESPNSKPIYAIENIDNFYQQRVYTNKQVSVSVEFKIDLLQEYSVNRIDVDLHMSNQNGAVQLLPMYSVDNYNWQQLPITDYTRNVVDKTTFQFSNINLRYIKFILTKNSCDVIHNNTYCYEFGFDTIGFYNNTFSIEDDSTLITKQLYVEDLTTKEPEEFSKLILEVCEYIPNDTDIDYYLSVSNDLNPATDIYVPIDPINRTVTSNPTVLDFGDSQSITVSGIKISYDVTNTGIYNSPSKSFDLIDEVVLSTPISVVGLASDTRYSFYNSNDRILDTSLKTTINYIESSFEVWRNISLKGTETKVRSYNNGWGFSEPYYTTTVYTSNAIGYEINFGSRPLVIDGIKSTGKVTFSKGKHTIAVHKDDWKYVDLSTVTNLTTLKAADSLYPYNYRYLIEGLNYPYYYPTTEEKIYSGFDIVAEYLMTQISIFDILHNVKYNDYSKYAIDLDSEDASRLIDGTAANTEHQTPNKVFVLKIDENNADFINEQFIIKFQSINTLYKYVKLKAVLTTEDTNITPMFDSYIIKLST